MSIRLQFSNARSQIPSNKDPGVTADVRRNAEYGEHHLSGVVTESLASKAR
jgi:hypothetical protein